MLESLVHGDSAFVTLTYRDEALPPGGTLVPRHGQLWLKSLRKAAGLQLRFYLVGEYGDLSGRAHYHAIIYGLPTWSELFQKTWKHGMVHVGELTPDSAQYVAGYVVKKLTKKGDPKLGGKHPEFARMSNGGGKARLGGIGAPAIAAIAEALTTDAGVNEIISTGDVPCSIKSGKRTLPLGRYLRSRLRKHLGHNEKTPEELLLRLQQEKTEILAAELHKPENKNKSVKRIFIDLNRQKVLNLETRLKIYSKKGDL